MTIEEMKKQALNEMIGMMSFVDDIVAGNSEMKGPSVHYLAGYAGSLRVFELITAETFEMVQARLQRALRAIEGMDRAKNIIVPIMGRN